MKRTDLNDLMNRCCEMTTVEDFERLLSDNNCHATAAEIDYEYINRYGFVDVVENDTNNYMFRVKISTDCATDIRISHALADGDFSFSCPAVFEHDIENELYSSERRYDNMTLRELDDFMMSRGYLSAEDQFENLVMNRDDVEDSILTYTMYTYADYDTAAEIELKIGFTDMNNDIDDIDDIYNTKIFVIETKIL